MDFVAYAAAATDLIERQLHLPGRDAEFEAECRRRGLDPAELRTVIEETLQAPAPPARPPAADAPPPVVGPYRVMRELDRGSFGCVFLAENTGLPPDDPARRVALKRVRRDATWERFRREVAALRVIDHPNVVRYYGDYEVDGWGFLAMELCDHSLPDPTPVGATPLPPGEAAELVRQIAAGVGAAHDLGIVHRDLKPANVLLTVNGTPKVADFGLARVAADPSLTATGVAVGTLRYMAPEQVAADRDRVGPATDVWALGVMLYELLTAHQPFEGIGAKLIRAIQDADPPYPRAVCRSVPCELEWVCIRCLHRDPARRYTSAGDLANELEGYLASGNVITRRFGRINRAVRWVRRHPVAAGVLATAQVALVGVAVAAVVAYQRISREQDATKAALADADENARIALEAVRRSLTQFGTPDPNDTEDTRQLRRLAAQAAATQLEQLAVRYKDVPRLRADYAEVHSLLGATERRGDQKGWADRAIAHLDQALPIQRELADADPSAENRTRLADTFRERGLAHRELKKLKDARADFDAALAAVDGLEADLGRVRTLVHRAGLLDFLDDPDLGPAARGPSYTEAAEVCERLAAGWPADPGRQEAARELARVANDFALFEQRHGHQDAARTKYDRAIHLRREFLKQAGEALEPINQLAAVLNNAGLFEMTTTGNLPRAGELLDESRRYREDLSRLFRGRYLVLSGLGHCCQNLALIECRQGRADAALKALRATLDLRKEAAQLNPTGGSSHLKYTLVLIAELAREAGDLPAAEAALAEAAEKLAPDAHYLQTVYHLARGRVLRAAGKFREAADALTLVEAAAGKAGNAPEYIRYVAEALTERGLCRAAAGDAGAARADFRLAVARAKDACRRQPGHWEHDVAHATAEFHLGCALLAAADPEAGACLTCACDRLKQLATRTPTCPGFARLAKEATDALARTAKPTTPPKPEDRP